MSDRSLGRLIDRATLDDLSAAAAAIGPGIAIRVIDAHGAVIARAGPAPETTEVASGGGGAAENRAIAIAGDVLGQVTATGPAAGPLAELLARVLAIAAAASEEARDERLAAARRAMEHELAIGRRIQFSLMPRRFPSAPGWEIASAYEPAREVGGDFYDAFTLRDDPERIGLVVADVTGKGIPAAILMADARALIHAAADHGGDPADTLARVNRILVSERASGLFVTVAHAVLHAPSGQLTVASAGHDPVHILRADSRLDVLDPPGRLVGMVADIATRSVAVELAPGDAFVGHTDGVTEARSPDGSFYSEDRFRALIASLAGESAAAIVDAVALDVARFRGDAEPSDDLTLLVVRRTV